MTDSDVRGGKEMIAQAAAGLALFKEDDKMTCDKDAAESYKNCEDTRARSLSEEAEGLTGKDNKKARQEKSKEAAAVKASDKYIDATRVLKDLDPKHGHFIKTFVKGADPVAEAAARKLSEESLKEEKTKAAKAGKPKADLAAGISKAERDELEKLKNDIIARKTELKAGGMSGGQMNKDEQIVGWVTRMNALKEKENPGSGTAVRKDSDNKEKAVRKVSSESQAESIALEKEIEEYKQKLVTEFKYSKKEIAADPDMVDMLAKLKKLSGGRKGS